MFREGEDRPVLVDLGLVRDLSIASITASWMRETWNSLFRSPSSLIMRSA